MFNKAKLTKSWEFAKVFKVGKLIMVLMWMKVKDEDKDKKQGRGRGNAGFFSMKLRVMV